MKHVHFCSLHAGIFNVSSENTNIIELSSAFYEVFLKTLSLIIESIGKVYVDFNCAIV